MKKLISMALLLVMLSATFVGCSSNGNEQTQTKNYDVKETLEKLTSSIPLTMASDIETQYLEEFIGIKKDDVLEYAGKVSMVNTSVDTILVVKAKPDKADAVADALKTYRDNQEETFKMYLEQESLKASSARIVTKGDYVIMVMAGDSTRIMDGELEAVYKEIDGFIESALA